MRWEELVKTIRYCGEHIDCKSCPIKSSELYNCNQIKRSVADTIEALRNELCLKCGRYHEAHKGACDGCRWRKTSD